MARRTVLSMELQIGFMRKSLHLLEHSIGMRMELKIAYIRFDETEVPEFSMDVYGKKALPNAASF